MRDERGKCRFAPGKREGAEKRGSRKEREHVGERRWRKAGRVPAWRRKAQAYFRGQHPEWQERAIKWRLAAEKWH